MKKRLVSLTLIIVLLLGSLRAVSAANSLMNEVVDSLLEYSSDARKNLFSIVIKPLIITDSGIDTIATTIKNYNPESDNFINKVFGKILGDVTEEEAIVSVNSLKLIEPTIRRKYANSFEKRETMRLSTEAASALQYFIEKSYNQADGLKQIMEEDGITTPVIANVLKMFVEMNGGTPILTDNIQDGADFRVYSISKSLNSKVNDYLAANGLGSSSSFINDFLDKLNNENTSEEKFKIKKFGAEIGFYTPFKQVVSGNNGTSSGGGSDNGNGTTSNDVVYEKDDIKIVCNVVYSSDIFTNVNIYGATVIEVAQYKNNVKQEFGKLDKDYTVTIPVTENNIMAYKIDDELIPVKYNISSDNELYMRIGSTGYYAVSSMPEYFTDVPGWGKTYIENLYNRGIINGKSDNIFAPEDNITREEFVKLIVELFDLNDNNYTVDFTDVKQQEWYYPYVAAAFKNGIIKGVGDYSFGIGQNISRQDICKIIQSVIELRNINVDSQKESYIFKDDSEIAGYAKESVNMMYRYGIVSGYETGHFYPKNNATRQEAAKIIYGLLELYVKSAQ